MGKIVFTCPKCSSHKVEEIMVGMTVATEIVDINVGEFKGHDTAGWLNGEQTNEGGYIDRYQCGECGFTIVDHDSSPDEGLDEHAVVAAIEELNNENATD